MRLLPEVLGVDRSPDVPDGVVLRLRVPSDLSYFEGHFAGLPVLPGVVQMHWAAHYAEKHLHVSCRASRIEQLKFLAIVRPRAELTLALHVHRGTGMLHFAYDEGARACSSGRMSLE